ncbi:Hypothetical protein A7982_00942 [Minicystis rosea]|nr:Hypothetical protein A7982_00942 [Minicystis rosea]
MLSASMKPAGHPALHGSPLLLELEELDELLELDEELEELALDEELEDDTLVPPAPPELVVEPPVPEPPGPPVVSVVLPAAHPAATRPRSPNERVDTKMKRADMKYRMHDGTPGAQAPSWIDARSIAQHLS